MVDNIIQLVTEKLSSLPCIEGIVLGGSRARGTHTEDSDIDIGIYYNPESFNLTAINQLATELDDEHRSNLVVHPGAWGDWVNGGGWLVINRYHVDLILRDIKRVEQIIKDTEQGIVTANYQTGHPHGYISAMYRGELAISKVLYNKNSGFNELKKKAEIYPAALKKSLINFFIFEAEFSLLFVKANTVADDKYYFAGHVFRIISCLNQVLFACHNAYCINEKKALKLIETFEHKPEKYAQKVNRIFEVLGLSLIECYEMTEMLYNEVKQIVSKREENNVKAVCGSGTLIVYYSLLKSTENLALEIALQTGGTLRELIPDMNYSFDYNTAAKEVRSQISRGFCPKLISGNEPIDDYPTIFIGSPNWYKTLAPPVLSFLRQHDFSGKIIIPFCTHGGGGFGQIEDAIAKECSKSIVLPGIAVNGIAQSEEVSKWLKTIGFKL